MIGVVVVEVTGMHWVKVSVVVKPGTVSVVPEKVVAVIVTVVPVIVNVSVVGPIDAQSKLVLVRAKVKVVPVTVVVVPVTVVLEYVIVVGGTVSAVVMTVLVKSAATSGIPTISAITAIAAAATRVILFITGRKKIGYSNPVISAYEVGA